jgi:hypothetical protein
MVERPLSVWIFRSKFARAESILTNRLMNYNIYHKSKFMITMSDVSLRSREVYEKHEDDWDSVWTMDIELNAFGKGCVSALILIFFFHSTLFVRYDFDCVLGSSRLLLRRKIV